MKYPLQKAIEDALIECTQSVNKASSENNKLALEIANKNFKNIIRINDICVNRKRY